MNSINEAFLESASDLYAWMTRPLFSVGSADFSAASLLKLVVFVVALIWGARIVRNVLLSRVFPRLKVETGVAHALANLSGYFMLTLGLLVGLQVSGIDLTTLTVLFGALGVGIGFGLQSLAANFVAGLVILLERPIQVGDRIQIGDLHGRVYRISVRSTEVLTNDEIAVIVPNSQIVMQQVVNWSRGSDRIRIRVPVGVHYKSDVPTVVKALLEAADAVDGMLKHPAPHVRLTAFGNSSIDFELLIWTSELLHQRGQFISRVNFAIHAALKRHGIEIPFPQRDIHVRSAIPLPVVSEGRPAPGA